MSLNIKKAKKELNWKPKLSLETIELTVDWYKSYTQKLINMEKFTRSQIEYYEEKNNESSYISGRSRHKNSRIYKNYPKPMIEIEKKPIICHIMDHYEKFGFKDFYIAAGYKGNVIKDFFKKQKRRNVKIINTGKIR